MFGRVRGVADAHAGPDTCRGTRQGGRRHAGRKGAGSDLGLNEIIVTGTHTGVRKFETSYAITTIDPESIAQKAPLGVADLIAPTPGIYVESSGGEVGNNVYSRGLPADNYRYLPLLEDGLPVWEEGAGAFTNADEFFRVDATVDSLQIVRGGSASITASNAPGGVVNVLTKRPTRVLQGLVKGEVGDWAHYRLDANVSGPLTDRLSFSIGGFYRADNGLRDPGFTGNRGGQLRLGLQYDFADSGSLFVGYRKLNDRNIFYTAIPLASTSQGLPGLDAGTGTLVSNAFAHLTVPDGNGAFTKNVDLTQGVYTDTDTFTGIFNKPLGDGWEINDRARYTKGVVDFNGLFSSGVATSQSFLASALTRLQAARPDTRARHRQRTALPRRAEGQGAVRAGHRLCPREGEIVGEGGTVAAAARSGHFRFRDAAAARFPVATLVRRGAEGRAGRTLHRQFERAVGDGQRPGGDRHQCARAADGPRRARGDRRGSRRRALSGAGGMARPL